MAAAAARSGRRSGCRRHRRDLRPPGLKDFGRGVEWHMRIQEVTLTLKRAVLYDRALRAPVQTLPTVDRAQLILHRVTSALNYNFFIVVN